MSKTHLVTVATHSERYLPVLDQQAKDKGVNLIKLGFGKKYEGHFMKDKEMIGFLKTVDEDDLVVFVDGFDTLFLGDMQEVREKFDSYGGDLLLSVENIGTLSFIHSSVFERVDGKYINTGLYMGKAGFLLKFLEDIYSRDTWNKKSNQVNWCTYLNKLHREGKFDGIKLDYNSDVFLNHSFTTSNYLTMKNKRINVDGHSPCFIQGNGCEDMTYIINDAGYEKFNVHKDEFFWKKMTYNLSAVFKIYNPIVSFYIYLLILLIVLVIFFIWRWNHLKKDDHFYFG